MNEKQVKLLQEIIDRRVEKVLNEKLVQFGLGVLVESVLPEQKKLTVPKKEEQKRELTESEKRAEKFKKILEKSYDYRLNEDMKTVKRSPEQRVRAKDQNKQIKEQKTAKPKNKKPKVVTMDFLKGFVDVDE